MHDIKIKVLGQSNGRFRLKVSIHDLGVHVMGMIVQDSKIEGEKWYVTTPAHKVGSKYYKDITFDTNKPLWDQVQRLCIKEVELYKLLQHMK